MSVNFHKIVLGKEYSRPQLAEIWGYASYNAIARGVVTPKGDNKIILFVTVEKQDSLEQYDDKLVEEYLHWEGPNDHFAERRMVEAKSNTEEIHLFYRAIHHSPFIYFGKIEVVDIDFEVSKPSKFIFHLAEYYNDITESTEQEGWSRQQLIVAFNTYLKLPFGSFDPRNEEVVKISQLIGKSTSSVAQRLNNFAYSDPYNSKHTLIGRSEGASYVQPIWNEFIGNQENVVFESEETLLNYQHKSIEETYPEMFFNVGNLKGEVRERITKTRVNQNIFRQVILKTYSNRCAISGIDVPELLVAGHIVPWSVNSDQRLNPENGICLSNLYDKAYDKGLICINTEYKVLISKRLKLEIEKPYFDKYFGSVENKTIILPSTYRPKREFLEYRLKNFEL